MTTPTNNTFNNMKTMECNAQTVKTNEDYVVELSTDGQKQNNEDYEISSLIDGHLHFVEPQMDHVAPISVNGNFEEVIQSGAHVTEATTTFVAGESKHTVESNVAKIPTLLSMSSDQTNSDDIKSFLSKPLLIASGSLSSTDTFNTFAASDNPNCLTTQALVQNKLSGFLGFRATLVLRWVINGNPFQQGRYMLTYVPFGGAPVTYNAGAWYTAHTNTLWERSQLRRIELDVSCDSEGIMKIPYESILNYYPLAAVTRDPYIGNLGRFQIFPYVPVTTGSGTQYVGYTLYAYFEDIDLVGAAVPQMGISSSERETRAAGKGPVSSTLLSFSKAAGVIAEVPLISNFASTVSWVLDIAGRSAKSAGFSKPVDLGPTQRINVTNASYLGSVDGVDQSVMCAGSSENVVAILPGVGGSDIDEMNINHIASIPGWFNTVTWSTGNGAGNMLMSTPVTPNTFQQTRTLAGLGYNNTAPIAFCANMFSLWRGSIVFKFKIVKTKFHAGRFSLSFFPCDPYLANTGALDEGSSVYVHRQIYDIRFTEEFEIVVPYVSTTPYLDSDKFTGNLVMHVVDQLVAPDTVASSVQFLCEVCAGPDFELARPVGTSRLGGSSSGTVFMGATPQMDIPTSAPETIGSTSLSGLSSTVSAMYCVGEKIISFRALAKIFRIQRLSSDLAVGTIESISPFAVHTTYSDSTPSVIPGDTYGDLYDLLGACYLYSRGSVRYKKQPLIGVAPIAPYYYTWVDFDATGPPPTTSLSSFSRGPNTIYNDPYNTTTIRGGKFVLTNGSTEQGIIEVTVPQYSARHSRNNICSWANPTTYYGESLSKDLGTGISLNTIASFNSPDYTSAPTDVAFANYRSLGEDGSFSGFVSTVPFFYYGTAGFV